MPESRVPIVRLVRDVAPYHVSGSDRLRGRIVRAEACHAAVITRLATEFRSTGPGRRGGFSGRGLLHAIASRPGRIVSAFLAWNATGGGAATGLVAVVTTGSSRRRHSIGWLLVAPFARRRGVGTSLVHAAVDEVRSAGGTEVWVDTHADWPDAIAFWHRLGFTPSPGPPCVATRSSGPGAS